ncbi:CCA tRNA nucleotidyltransferase, partial [Candidatus Poribacteria bacterium]|nr:CCA tRNA nucleotidyltransferase [Candidatus Poribacteria bacterium]
MLSFSLFPTMFCIKRKMVLNIPETLSDILHEIGEIAGENAYLVGGSVRDLLLERKNIDIDIVVEGDAISVAKQLQKRWKGTCQTHSQFGTATVTPANPDRPKVDFVTARSETYKKSGTLPKVEPGTLTEDLHRRDFSINALAMCLDNNAFGTIIDATEGIEDLKNGIIRVLHTNSYDDDPTRIFRSYRYAGRYNFRIADADIPLIEKAIPLISNLSGERIRNEIDRIFLEDNAQQIIQDLAEVGVYEAIYPEWKIYPSLSCDLNIVKQAIAWAAEHIEDISIQEEQLYWMTMFGLGNKQIIPTYYIEAICFRLLLPHQLSRVTNVSQQLRNVEISNNDIRSIFDKVDIKLSENAIYEFQNGKWCIVDIDNKVT